MIGHDRTDGEACSKEKVGNINVIPKGLLGYGVAILVNETKIGNPMILFDVLNRGIDHFGVYIIGLINPKALFGGQSIVNGRNDDHRQEDHHQSKTFVFGQKLPHFCCFVAKVTPQGGIIQPRALKLL